MKQGYQRDYVVRVGSERAVAERRIRRWRSVVEKHRIVELTFEPDAECGIYGACQRGNANQVFKWRSAFERGELFEPAAASTALLPVIHVDFCQQA